MAKGEFVGHRVKQLACPDCGGATGLYESQLNNKTRRVDHSCDICGVGLVIHMQGKDNEHIDVTKSGTKRLKTLVLLRTHGRVGNLKHIAVYSGFFLSPNEAPSEGLKRQKRLDKLQFEFPDKPITLENYSTLGGVSVESDIPLIYMDTILVPKRTVGYIVQTDFNRSFPENRDSWITLFPQLRFSRMS